MPTPLRKQQPTPPVTTQPSPWDIPPWMAGWFQQQPQAGIGLGDLSALLHPPVQHMGAGGAAVTPENPTGDPRNPWGTGFFKTNAERAQIEGQRLGVPTTDTYTGGGINPAAHAATVAAQKYAGTYRPPGTEIGRESVGAISGVPTAAPTPIARAMPTPTGAEVMLNPNAANPWADANYGQIVGGLSKKKAKPGSPTIVDEGVVRARAPFESVAGLLKKR